LRSFRGNWSHSNAGTCHIVSPEACHPKNRPLMWPFRPMLGSFTSSMLHRHGCYSWVSLEWHSQPKKHLFLIVHFTVSFDVSETASGIGNRCTSHIFFGGGIHRLTHYPGPTETQGHSSWIWLGCQEGNFASSLVRRELPWAAWPLSPEE
jgi:hypothetical protein